MGSNGYDLVGDSLMHLLTSSSVPGLKVLTIESRRHRIWCIIERARSRKRVPDFAYFIGEERSKHVSKAFFLVLFH